MKKIFTTVFVFVFSVLILAQAWEQTAETPQGSGVTHILARQSNRYLYVTTGSYNWPQVPGGVRLSTDDGATWQNQIDAYVARTIIEGPEGYLYASIWPNPGTNPADGIFRSIDGINWNPLWYAPAGDNVFSLAINPTSPVVTILGGTRNGVVRSTDNGNSFQNSSSGIPSDSWTTDIQIKSDGIIFIATTNGVFFSTDNGNTWSAAQGIPAGDTVNTLIILPQVAGVKDAGSFDYIVAGTVGGEVLRGIWNGTALVFTAVYLMTGDPEFAGFIAYFYYENQKWILFSALYDAFGTTGGVAESEDDGDSWDFLSEGLTEDKISAIALMAFFGDSPNQLNYNLYAGTFLNQPDGAKIFRLSSVTDIKEQQSLATDEFRLEQNYPNPFNPSTKISFILPKESFTTLEVYNSLGENVSTLVSKNLNAGSYHFEWSGKGLSSGVYFYRINAGSFSETRKMILLK